MKIRTILIVLLVVIAGTLAAFFLFQSEEKKVKKQFQLLSQWVSKEPGENPLISIQKIRNIGTLFAESCRLRTPYESVSGSFTPEEISSYAARGRMQCAQLSLRFYDFDIHFPEKGLAKVTLTAKLTGKSVGGESIDETREMDCLLRKVEKKWLFSAFEVVEVLRR